MKVLKKIGITIVLLIATVFTLLVGLGFLADPQHRGKQAEIIRADPATVWQLLEDTERFSLARHEVDRMEFTENNVLGYPQWIEYVGLWGSMHYEIVQAVPGKLLEVNLKNSDFGLSGTWLFKLEPCGEDQTLVTILENSRNDGLMMRSILNALGRDANMKLLLSVIRNNV